MAITLTFTDESLGGDIDLQGGDVGVLQYDPQPPQGGAVSVTETITIYISDGAQASRTNNGFIHRLERYFERARRRQKQKTGARVYLKYKPYDADDLYRTEILDGRVVWQTNTAAAAWMPSDTGECAINFTRKPYWEADTEVELSLANTGDSGTGGIMIYDHNDKDANEDNWVLIDGADVIGSIPAPARIRLENDLNVFDYRKFWIAHTVETDDDTGSDQVWTIEGEDNEESPDTPVADSDSSGGFYMPQQWTATTETLVFEWTLDGTYLAAAKGNPFRAIARLVTQGYGDLYLRLALRAGGSGDLWSSQLILADSDTELIDFSTIPSLPPQVGGTGATGYTDHVLRLYATRAQSGTHTIRVDCIHLLPMDGGLRIIESVASGSGVGSGEYLIDDGINEEIYRLSGSDHWGMFNPSGDWIRLIPGRTQRIAFLWYDTFDTAEAVQTAIVRIYYRPRRASF